MDKLRLGEHFHYLGTVDEKDLACLYKSSRVFCFPSLYEGFGMPVAEAMSCGCAVVTSNTSSLPEVAGNAALLIDPENEDEIFSALAYLYENPDKVKELTTLAQTRAELFSWKTFSNTVRSLF